MKGQIMKKNMTTRQFKYFSYTKRHNTVMKTTLDQNEIRHQQRYRLGDNIKKKDKKDKK